MPTVHLDHSKADGDLNGIRFVIRAVAFYSLPIAVRPLLKDC